MTKFKIQGVGIDTSTISFNPGRSRSDDGYSYVYTSIPANNDFIVGDYIKSLKGTPPILVYTDFLDSIDIALKGHLDAIGRTKAQLLLVDTFVQWDRVENLKGLPVEHFGIQNPETKEQIEEVSRILEKNQMKLEYVAINTCPLEFNLEILDYCRENGILIIGLNPMGGYLSAARNITAFSVPYLLGFSANYCDIVLVSGRDLIKAWDDKDYLEDLVGRDSNPGYTLKKNTSKPVKEIKQAVFTSINVGGIETVPYIDPEIIPDYNDFVFKIGSHISKITEKVIEGDKIESFEDEVTNYLRILHYPEDGNEKDNFAIARYKALDYIRVRYPENQGWSIDQIKVGTNLLLMSIEKAPEYKGHFIWQRIIIEEPKQFYMILPLEGKDKITFVEAKNTEEKE